MCVSKPNGGPYRDGDLESNSLSINKGVCVCVCLTLMEVHIVREILRAIVYQ